MSEADTSHAHTEEVGTTPNNEMRVDPDRQRLVVEVRARSVTPTVVLKDGEYQQGGHVALAKTIKFLATRIILSQDGADWLALDDVWGVGIRVPAGRSDINHVHEVDDLADYGYFSAHLDTVNAVMQAAGLGPVEMPWMRAA